MQDELSFIAARDPQMDFVLQAGKLRHASRVGYRLENLLVDGTFADFQAMGYLAAGSADVEWLCCRARPKPMSINDTYIDHPRCGRLSAPR